MSGQRRQKKPVLVSGDWHPADVKAALEKNGWTIRGLADHYDVHPATIAQALRSKYRKSERRIANAIGVEPSTLWPSRYPRATPKRGCGNQERVSRKRRRDRSTPAHNGHGKHGEAN